ncbi:hypothetical protein BDR06DRAFT_1023076 [Suillus hirtellus]|nr:hypothetical protein BDR06DRAFT_1023076 [Suillus hirtellus]
MPLLVLNITPATSNSSYISATFSAYCIILPYTALGRYQVVATHKQREDVKVRSFSAILFSLIPGPPSDACIPPALAPSPTCFLALSRHLVPSRCCSLAFSYPPLFATCTLPPCIAPAPVLSDKSVAWGNTVTLTNDSRSPSRCLTEASPFARPHSRTQSQPFTNIGIHFSPDWDHLSSGEYSPIMDSPFDYRQKGNSFARQLSSLPMERSASDSDYGENATSSTLSLEPTERLEALQKANAELGRKLIEAEMTLESRLNEHNMDLDATQGRSEELKSRLTSTKREEKELRTKGGRNG